MAAAQHADWPSERWHGRILLPERGKSAGIILFAAEGFIGMFSHLSKKDIALSIKPKSSRRNFLRLLFLGAFRRGNKPPVLPGEEKQL